MIKMKSFITISLSFIFCILLSQDTLDAVTQSITPVEITEFRIGEIKSEIEKDNQTIYILDSLVNSNQLLTNIKIIQLEKSNIILSNIIETKIITVNKSIEQIKINLEQIIANLENDVYNNLINSNLHFDQLKIMIGSLTDSLLTNANSILRVTQQNSFNEAFLMARLELGKNQQFEWNDKRYSTNYPEEIDTPPLVREIETIKLNLEEKVNQLDNAINKANDKLDVLDSNIEEVNAERINQIITLDQEINKTISSRTIYWIIAIFIILLIVFLVFFFFKSKMAEQRDSLSSVKNTQEKLENEAILLDTKLIQLLEQKLEIAQLQPQETPEVDHSLPLKLAEEIHRMRKRLKIMEESQGTKVLKKRIESLEDKINDMGYEIVNLEGQAYDERMTLNVLNIVESKEFNQNEKNISRVIKPQVKFNDEIIQPGDIEVTQGIN